MKQQIMKDFRDKKIDILIATTIIEVGLDIPNATLVMLVEHAEDLVFHSYINCVAE